jgi:hypothetical protein
MAFYLPQFHPIPENDRWWGKGFTEWTNVRRGVQLFPNHYQPHVPTVLGQYDLRDPLILQSQAETAQTHGIHGFCYYYYWFGGKKLLEMPVERMITSGQPDMPFCLCWANSDWRRSWALSGEVLMAQEYSGVNSRAFLRELLPCLFDKRYITIDGSPLLLVYETGAVPDIKRTSDIWREEAVRAGLPGLYLASVESLRCDVPPEEMGFDGAVEFAPDWRMLGPLLNTRLGVEQPPNIVDYRHIVSAMMAKPAPSYTRFRCAFPGWDNSPRKGRSSLIVHGSSPRLFGVFLNDLFRYTRENFPPQKQLLFINAWNEWGEGCHLEPDELHGMEYLNRCRIILRQ